MTRLLETRGLEVRIGDLCICRDLDWHINEGEVWGILGPNGGGKTTLLHHLAGLRSGLSGELRFWDRPLSDWPRHELAQRMAVLFQDQHDPFPASVLDTALIGRHPHLQGLQWEGPRDREIALDCLKALELDQLRARLVTKLSGGERQRLAIATLLTQRARLNLLDEPTNHLDVRHALKCLNLIASQGRRPGQAAVMVLHDVNLAARFCSHLLLLHEGGQVAQGPCADLLQPEQLSRLYGHPMRNIRDGNLSLWLPA